MDSQSARTRRPRIITCDPNDGSFELALGELVTVWTDVCQDGAIVVIMPSGRKGHLFEDLIVMLEDRLQRQNQTAQA